MSEATRAATAVDARDLPSPIRTHASFDRVYRSELDRVYRFCASQVGVSAADDVVAETFLRAWRAWHHRGPGPGNAVPWLLRIARNVAANHRRGINRRREEGLDHLSASAAANVETEVARRLELAAVECAMRGLGHRDRLLIGLRCASGLSHAEIGTVVGIDEGTARVGVHRALQRLRAALEDSRCPRTSSSDA